MDIINKLPIYKDTGEPFVPMADPCWIDCYQDSYKKCKIVDVSTNKYPIEWNYDSEFGWVVAWGGNWHGATTEFYAEKPD